MNTKVLLFIALEDTLETYLFDESKAILALLYFLNSINLFVTAVIGLRALYGVRALYGNARQYLAMREGRDIPAISGQCRIQHRQRYCFETGVRV